MKKICVLITLLIVCGLGAIAYTNTKLGSIMGKVVPNEAGANAFVIVGKDTLSTPILNGSFKINNLKQGVYNVLIKANAAYRDTTLVKVAVKDSSTTDLGQIRLMPQQQQAN